MDCKLMWGWPRSKFSLQEWPWHFDSPTFLSVYSIRKKGTTSLVPTVKLLFTVHSPGENKSFFRWEKTVRYKWYFVSKIVLTYCEKKYEPFIQTVKRGKTIFETEYLFLLEFSMYTSKNIGTIELPIGTNIREQEQLENNISGL